jgi:hypothetical protein
MKIHPIVFFGIAGLIVVGAFAFAKPGKKAPGEEAAFQQRVTSRRLCGEFREARPHPYDWTASEAELSAECKKQGF